MAERTKRSAKVIRMHIKHARHIPAPCSAQERFERAVRHAAFAQRLDRAAHVIERRAVAAARAAEHGAHDVVGAACRCRSARRGASRTPARRRAGRRRACTAATPDGTSPSPFRGARALRDAGRAFGREPERDAGARAAAIEREHEARLLRRAAIHARPQIQPAMIAMHLAAHGFDGRQAGIPDQRAIAEQPQVALAVPVARACIRATRASSSSVSSRDSPSAGG